MDDLIKTQRDAVMEVLKLLKHTTFNAPKASPLKAKERKLLETEVKTHRDRAIRVLRQLKQITVNRVQSTNLTNDERELLGVSHGPLDWSFEELDRHFIAPMAKTSLKAASYGYRMLEILMLCAISESTFGAIIDNAANDRAKHRTRSSNGGSVTGAANKANADAWKAEALQIALKYVANHRKYSQEELSVHIKSILKNHAPKFGQIKNIVSGWQRDDLLPKGQVKHASSVK
jgi:hypothetical protein